MPGWFEFELYTFLFVYVDDIHVLDASIHTVTQNTAALLIASGNVCLEVNVAKTTCMCVEVREECAG